MDVVQDSGSDWAEDGYHHWVFREAHLFPEPATGIRTTRTGLWTHDLPEWAGIASGEVPDRDFLSSLQEMR